MAYLPEFGWEAAVVTPPLGGDAENRLGFPGGFLRRTQIVEAPYRGDIFWFWRLLFKLVGFRMNESLTEQIKENIGVVKQRSFVDVIMTLYQTLFAYPDTERTWKKAALGAADRALGKERFDAILSSSPFPTSHIVAARLQKKHGLPWIADFRDPWTLNHNYPYSILRKKIETNLELATMRRASVFITASPFYAKKIAALHNKPVAVITNGFDTGMVKDKVGRLTEKFTITYTGSIYPGKQDPRKFLLAVKNLLENDEVDSSDISVRFYGKIDNWLKNEITTNRLVDTVKQYGTISRKESFARQRESQLLLLLNWEDPAERGVYPLKFFEYLSTGRPILATGGLPKDEIERMLGETRAGIYAPTVEEIESALLSAYDEFKKLGSVSYNGDQEKIGRYSYRENANQLAIILNRVRH